MSAFYENVPRHRVEARELAEGEKEENLVLEFKPNPPQDMLIACLWSKWTGKGEPDLLSFAAVTDDPSAEIALAGHDRCIVPIKPENANAWLIQTRLTWLLSTPFSMIVINRITSIASQRDPTVFATISVTTLCKRRPQM